MYLGLLFALSFALYADPVSHLNATPAVLVSIAQCESGGQQYKPDGSLVKDYATGDHVGLYQISKKQWRVLALKMGWDIFTPEGNTAMALWLYHQYGTSPWLASESCWGKEIT